MRDVISLLVLVVIASCDLPQLAQFDRVDDPLNFRGDRAAKVLAFEASTGDGSVTLQWPTVDKVDGYYVYYQEGTTVVADETKATKVEALTAALKVSGLTNGTTYTFVYAPYSGVVEGKTSLAVTATPGAVPTQVYAVATGSSIVLGWSKFTGASLYHVYQSTTGTATTASTLLASPTENRYEVTPVLPGNTYSFVITAVNDFETRASDAVSAKTAIITAVGTAPTPGVLVTVSPTDLYGGVGVFTTVQADTLSASSGWYASGRSAGNGPSRQALLARFSLEGALDTNFGGNTDSSVFNASVPQHGSVQLANDQSYADGFLQYSSELLLSTTLYNGGEANNYFKFDANGKIDLDYNNNSMLSAPFGRARGNGSPLVDGSGRVYTLGISAYPNYNVGVSRWPASSRIDPNDAATALWTAPVAYPAFIGSKMAFQSDGKIVVAGMTASGEAVITRVLSNGSSDGTFGSLIQSYSGVAWNGSWGSPQVDGDVTTGIRDMVIDPFDRIIVVGAGTVGGQLKGFVARFNSDGTVDTSFGASGTTTLADPYVQPYGIVLQSDGNILVVGDTGTGVSSAVHAFAVRLFGSGGTVGQVDSTWGSLGGFAPDDQGNGSAARSIAINAQGRIAIAGYVILPLASPSPTDTLPCLWLY